ncbi:MAG: hypothetical protein KKA07_10990 [Bacteroidetes bacterium]|nr:hypothetical protein [Bacteroidota bacterium]MBU1719584.1 hypothetical protein [Bacteroidota bacterium]
MIHLIATIALLICQIGSSAQTAVTYTYENGNRIQRKAIIINTLLSNSTDSTIAQIIPAAGNDGEYAENTAAASNSIEENGIRIFPNPAHTELCVQATGEIPQHIVLCEPGGKEVLRISPSAALSTLNVAGLAVGQYHLRVIKTTVEENFLIIKH